MWLGYHRISRIGGRADTPISEGEYRTQVSAYAERQGFEVELLPVEVDQTGSRMSRPILDGAIERIEAGEAEGLIVVRYNRLSRATVADTHLVVERIEAAGGQVRAVAEDYPDTPEGRMARNMSFGVSRMEWERSSAFIRAAKIGAVEKGVWPMSIVPMGYVCRRKREGGDGKLYPGPDRHLIERAFRERAAGASWRRVAEILGVGPSGAAKIIANPVYLGEIRLKVGGREYRKVGAHEPLVDRATWEAAQAGRSTRRERRRHDDALLAGLIRCAGCSRTLTLDRSHSPPGYRCHSHQSAVGKCPAPAWVSQRAVEEYVESLVVPYLERLAAEGHPSTDDLDAAQAEVAEAEAELERVWEIVRASGIAVDRAAEQVKDASARLDAARAKLARVQRESDTTPVIAGIGKLWREWSVEQRRHVLSRGLGVVWVRKGRGLAIEERVRVIAAGFEPDNLSRSGRGGSVPIRSVPDGDLPGQIGPLGAEDVEGTPGESGE